MTVWLALRVVVGGGRQDEAMEEEEGADRILARQHRRDMERALHHDCDVALKGPVVF
jgi:hypothetical protein